MTSHGLHVGMYLGTVVDRDDPEQLGRARVQVPGLVEPASGWAWPLGTSGGGAKDRGMFSVPAVGATVAVFFRQGDLHEPFYLCSAWGKPGGDNEVPPEAQASPPDNHVIATPTFIIELDERSDGRRLALTNRATGDRVAIDGETNAIEIDATTDVSITATGRINIQGLVVSLNGRVVAPGPNPI